VLLAATRAPDQRADPHEVRESNVVS
jgi:hypothetical protein